MLPLPAYAVILVLAIASIGPAIHLPDIDANAPRSDGAAPLTLLEHGGMVRYLCLNYYLIPTQLLLDCMFPGLLMQTDKQMISEWLMR